MQARRGWVVFSGVLLVILAVGGGYCAFHATDTPHPKEPVPEPRTNEPVPEPGTSEPAAPSVEEDAPETKEDEDAREPLPHRGGGGGWRWAYIRCPWCGAVMHLTADPSKYLWATCRHCGGKFRY